MVGFRSANKPKSKNAAADALAPLSGTKSAKRRTRKSQRSNGSSCSAAPKFFKSLISQSFDEAAFFRPVDFQQQQEEEQENIQQGVRLAKEQLHKYQKQQQGPTHDFSMHSCSMSPTSTNEGDEQYFLNPSTMIGGGLTGNVGTSSLVTHKPRRLHKKILNTFRKGSNGLKKKSRKSFA